MISLPLEKTQVLQSTRGGNEAEETAKRAQALPTKLAIVTFRNERSAKRV